MQTKDEDYWQPEFSTYYLKPLVINGHLISPLLQIDGKGHRYYIMTNSGPINGTHDVLFNIYPQHDIINTATPFESVPDKDALKILEKEKGKIIVMSFMIDKNFKLSDLTTESGDPNEIFNSQEVNKQFADFSVLASKGDAQKILDSGEFPLISAIFNKPLDANSIINPSKIPYCIIYSR